MSEAVPHKNLPILLGIIRQETGDGELVLEQNDGVRSFCFLQGELVYLKSDAAGEQFGSYLLRQGILDLASLNELLAHAEPSRIGEKVIQCGWMSLAERDHHLQCLQEQIMINALEHPVLGWTWNADARGHRLVQDLHFELQHRHFVWRTFQEFNDLKDLRTVLETETSWRWEGRQDLLNGLSDLPLTSSTAYALSFLAADPIGFETFRFLSHLDEDDASRFIATLWALGALTLSSGQRPSVCAAPPPGSSTSAPALPLIMPPASTPFGPPKRRAQAARTAMEGLDIDTQPEFIDPDPIPEGDPDPPEPLHRRAPIDMPPCGPRPQARPQSSPRPDDMPPCGPRPEPRLQPHPLPPPLPPDLPPCEPDPQPRVRCDMSSQPVPIELDPEHTGVPAPPTPQSLLEARQLLDRARRQVKLGRTVEAVFTLEEAVRVLPEGDAAYEAWLMLGKLRMANLAWSARAIHALQRASRIRAREVEPWITMGKIHRMTGSESEAVACFRKVRELDPSVAIPPGMDLRETPNRAPLGKPSRKGLFGGHEGKP